MNDLLGRVEILLKNIAQRERERKRKRKERIEQKISLIYYEKK
jgi:hypothetical protein